MRVQFVRSSPATLSFVQGWLTGVNRAARAPQKIKDAPVANYGTGNIGGPSNSIPYFACNASNF